MISQARFKLREATRPHHDRIEAGFTIAGLAGMESYKATLQNLYGFFRDWEPKIIRRADSYGLDFYRERQKLPLLEQDLAFFQMERTSQVKARDWTFPNIARLLGSVYVIEGSTLGARIISTELTERFDVRRESGGAYFFSYGEETGSRWRNFCEVLDQHIANDIDDAIAGASETFEIMDETLRGAGT
jgi:heme oxygenase